MKLCMKGNFVRIKNMSKEQLCKLKVWDFFYGFPGPKAFRDLRETAPWLCLAYPAWGPFLEGPEKFSGPESHK